MDKKEDNIKRLLREAFGVSDEQLLKEEGRLDELIPDSIFTVSKEEREAILKKLYEDKVIR